MGRKRVISEDQILDAAQYVVGKEGAGQLTVDAVAERAGISKASVLYLYKSKKALVEAVVQRAVRWDSDLNETAIQSFGTTDGSVVRGRILAAAEPFPEDSRSVALNLCAAAAQDPQLRKPMQDFQSSIVGRIGETSSHVRGAMLAHLALEGLKLLEILGFHTWTRTDRNRLLQDIDWLVDIDPKPTSKSSRMMTPPHDVAKLPHTRRSPKRDTSPEGKDSSAGRRVRKRD